MDNEQVVIDVKNVSMVFNMANQALGSLKEYAIALARRELMFKEFRALNNVSFQVKKGDVYGILGTNGSGKSTLLKIISGVLTPTEGSVEVTGKIVPLIEMTAGFDIELTGRENIYLNGSLLGYTREYIDQHFDDIVSFAEIDGFLDIPLKSYSSGMVSRIAFAIATVMVPDILIVDEVLAVGDFMFQEKCEERIQSLIHDHGVTVLIVSHSIAQIERLCNKAIWIEKSRPRMMGPALEVCERYKALGGHEGSREAEREVLDLVQSADVDAAAVPCQTMASQHWYDTAVDILELCAFDPAHVQDVVVTTGDNVPDRLVALGVAGALGAPLLFVHERDVAKRVASAIAAFRPQRIVALSSVNRGRGLAKGTVRQLRSLCAGGSAAQVVNIAGTSEQLAERAGAYLDERGVAYKAAKAFVDQETDLVTLSPVLYETGTVVQLFEDAAAFQACSLLVFLDAQSSRVQSCYGSLLDYADAVPELTWLKDAAEEKTEVDLVLTTLNDPSDTLSAAIFVAQKHANLLQLSRGNLDSVAATMHAIEEFPFAVKSLTFIGGTFCFTEVDKQALRKAAVLNRRNHGLKE